MTSIDVVQQYLDAFFGERIDHGTIRALISEGFTFEGPLMSADGADDYIEKLKGFGENAAMSADIHTILADENTVVARYDFIVPAGAVPASEWYTVEDQKITSIQLICDPRPFFA